MRRRLLLSYLAVAVLVLALLEIPLGISYAMTTFSPTNGGHGDYQYVMVAALLVTLPMLILFAFAQRYFIEGIATQGRKG